MRLALLVLLGSTPAFADREPVRDDIVDLRHQRTPDRRVFLGWTADGRAVSHLSACGVSDGGGPFCSSQLEVTGEAPRVLLQPECAEPCDPYTEGFHWSVPRTLASRAIRTERTALQALGPLHASTPGPRPAVEVRAKPCAIDVLVGERRITVDTLGAQCISEGGDASFRDAKLLGVELSPDLQKLAVRIEVIDQVMEYADPRDLLVVIDAA